MGCWISDVGDAINDDCAAERVPEVVEDWIAVADRPLPVVGLVILSINSISFLNGPDFATLSDSDGFMICQSGSLSLGFRGDRTCISSSLSSSSLEPDIFDPSQGEFIPEGVKSLESILFGESISTLS